jgi:hypothetical protein
MNAKIHNETHPPSDYDCAAMWVSVAAKRWKSCAAALKNMPVKTPQSFNSFSDDLIAYE